VHVTSGQPRRALVVILAFAAVLALAVGVVTAVTGSGEARPSLPRTAFEQSGGARITTLAEERRFLRRVDVRSPRVRIARLGLSRQGRPLRLVIVGPARTREEIAANPGVLFVCAQHGNEPAGREACLQRIRDHARTRSRTTLLFVPTANPDGLVADSRPNADGVDMNRDHLALLTPEARAIAAVLRDYRPDVLGDMHEYRKVGSDVVEFHDPAGSHPNTNPAVRDLSGELSTRYLTPFLRERGFVTGTYPPSFDAGTLRVMAGLRHSVAALVETPRRGPLSLARRVAGQQVAMSAILKMFRERRAEVAAATADSAQAAAREGAARDAPLYFAPDSSTRFPPCGYRLSGEQFAEVRTALDLHGIRAIKAQAQWSVPLDQPAQPVIPLLLDPRSPVERLGADSFDC